jgi:hypothetical protein
MVGMGLRAALCAASGSRLGALPIGLAHGAPFCPRETNGDEAMPRVWSSLGQPPPLGASGCLGSGSLLLQGVLAAAPLHQGEHRPSATVQAPNGQQKSARMGAA